MFLSYLSFKVLTIEICLQRLDKNELRELPSRIVHDVIAFKVSFAKFYSMLFQKSCNQKLSLITLPIVQKEVRNCHVRSLEAHANLDHLTAVLVRA